MVEVLRIDQESNDRYDLLRENLKKLNSFTEDFIDDVIDKTRSDENLYQRWAAYAAQQLEEMNA